MTLALTIMAPSIMPRRRKGARSSLRHDRRSATTLHRSRSSAASPITFCADSCQTQVCCRPEALSWRQATPVQARSEGTIYTCPMHPEIRQIGPGHLPDLRHGARAASGHRRRRAQPRTRRYDAAVLDRPRADAAGVRAGDGRPSVGLHGWFDPSARRTGSSSSSQRRWCCGRAGRSSCAAGSRSSPAISTCSR